MGQHVKLSTTAGSPEHPLCCALISLLCVTSGAQEIALHSVSRRWDHLHRRSWDILEDTPLLGQGSLALLLQMAQAATSPPAQDKAVCCQSKPLLPAAAARHLLSRSHSPSGSWLCHPLPKLQLEPHKVPCPGGLPEPLAHTPCPRCSCQRPRCCSAKSLAPPSRPPRPHRHSHQQELHGPALEMRSYGTSLRTPGGHSPRLGLVLATPQPAIFWWVYAK